MVTIEIDGDGELYPYFTFYKGDSYFNGTVVEITEEKFQEYENIFKQFKNMQKELKELYTNQEIDNVFLQ